MSISLAIFLFTIVVSLVWLFIWSIRKLVILALCRRALRNTDKNRVEFILREGMELAYLTPLDIFQIRQRLHYEQTGNPPPRTRSHYLAAAIRRTFLFWRKK